jgi:hypothetical protein
MKLFSKAKESVKKTVKKIVKPIAKTAAETAVKTVGAVFKSAATNVAKTTVRSVSMLYTEFQILHNGWKPHHQIAEGLFLGMIPIKKAWETNEFDDQHLAIIELAKKSNAERPLKLVISTVEHDELLGKGFASIKEMVSTDEWMKNKVEQVLVSVPDFSANVKNEIVIDAIEKMRKCIENKGAVYVHCKAGRSRSAMLCVIYLSVYGLDPTASSPMTFEAAFNIVKSKRPQVELHETQKAKAAEVIAILKAKLYPDAKSATQNWNAKKANTVALAADAPVSDMKFKM